MTNFIHLKELEEAFIPALENRLQSPQGLEWSKVIRPRFVTNNDLFTTIADEAVGILPAYSTRRDTMKEIEMPNQKVREGQAIIFGGVIEITEDDVIEASGPKLLDGTTIVMRRSKAETEAQAIRRAVNALEQLALNTILKVAGEFLKGQISITDVGNIPKVINTQVTDGNAVSTLWTFANQATATPINDMKAIEVAIGALNGNYGAGLEYGNTIIPRKVLNDLLQLDDLRKLPNANYLPSTVVLEEVQRNPIFARYFGQVIEAIYKYPSAANTYTHPLWEDYIYCASGTQLQPAGELLIAPGGLDERFTNSRGFGILVNRVPSNDLKVKPKIQVAIQGQLIAIQYRPIYKKKVQ